MNKHKRQHIGIAGAGLMGKLLAWQLHQLGHQVTLFDADISGHSSAGFAAAGMLTPFAESTVADDLVLTLGLDSLTLWPQLLKTLSADILFSQTGSIITCHRHDHSELAQFIQRLSSKIDHQFIQPLDNTALSHLEPELDFDEGYHLKLEGFLDARSLLQKLHHYIETSSIKLAHQRVQHVLPKTIIIDNIPDYFDCVFDCRGYGGHQHFPDLRAVRGEIIRVYAPDVNMRHMIRLMHPRHPLYIVPMRHHRYIIGATEIESEDDSPISVRSCLELLSAAYSLHKGFAEARIIETQSARRPTLFNNSPRILYEDGFIAVNGLYRHGFLIAPALAQECITLFNTGVIDQRYAGLIMEKVHAS